MMVFAEKLLLLGLISSIRRSAADFTGISFDRITESGPLSLTWDNDGLSADSFPLVVAVSLINQTDSGVYGVRTHLSGTNSEYHVRSRKTLDFH